MVAVVGRQLRGVGWVEGGWGGLQYAKMQLNSSLPQRYCSKQMTEKGKKKLESEHKSKRIFWSSTLQI